MEMTITYTVLIVLLIGIVWQDSELRAEVKQLIKDKLKKYQKEFDEL